MKLSIFLSSVFFAASILAAPKLRDGRRGTLTSTRTRQGGLIRYVDGPTTLDTNIFNSDYSANWAGVILTAPPSKQTFNAVSGSFTVPIPSVPSGKTGSYTASIWVGIDGASYNKAILQVGVDITATKSGSTTSHSYDAWYEWFPDYAHDFNGFAFTAGDVITATVVSTSSKADTVTLTNLSTGKSVLKTLTPPTSSAVLGGQSVEWIVEDCSSNGGLVPFADFGKVVFNNTIATASGGTTRGAGGGTMIEIKSGKVLTNVVIGSEREITVTHV